jgi:ectoine hydroxylase-related dioxygenase (phytanoyl-CoA dioxygenase family)
MDEANWEGSPDLAEIYRDLIKHDLVEHVAELDAFGFTVVPPEKVAPPEFHEQLREALLTVHERRTGHRITDIATGTTGLDNPKSTHFDLLKEDPAFQQMLLNPAVYALARYQCGKSVVLGDMLGAVFGKGAPMLGLHTDQHATPPPLPQYVQTTNITWALTDFTPEAGPVAIVPMSHRFGRRPEPREANFLAPDAPVAAVPVRAAAGSLIVWGGTTWHGTFPRTQDGLRLKVTMVFSRVYMRPIRDLRRETPPEILANNPPEFRALLGVDVPYPFPEDGLPTVESITRFIAAGDSQWS